MSEKYTPDEAELIGCYAGAMEEQAGEDYATAKADAERGIAKIRADVLRDVQAIFEKSAREGVNTWDPAMVSCVIGARAAKFEQEAIKK